MFSSNYYVFYKKNLGEGNFNEPKFLYKITSSQPDGILYENLGVFNLSSRAKYFRKLMKQADNSYKNK